MAMPNDRKYSQTHEWFKVEGDVVTVGISQFAADELTDITFVDLPEVGAQVEGGSHFGEVESVKAVSDLYAPCDGEVVAVNDKLPDSLETLSAHPYDTGWIAKIKISDDSALAGLMDHAAYQAMCETGASG